MTTSPDPSFATWLAQYGHGSLDDKLTAALAEVARGWYARWRVGAGVVLWIP